MASVLAHVILAQFPQYYTVSGRSEHLFFIAVSGSARDVRKKLFLRNVPVDIAGTMRDWSSSSLESQRPLCRLRLSPLSPNVFLSLATGLRQTDSRFLRARCCLSRQSNP